MCTRYKEVVEDSLTQRTTALCMEEAGCGLREVSRVDAGEGERPLSLPPPQKSGFLYSVVLFVQLQK